MDKEYKDFASRLMGKPNVVATSKYVKSDEYGKVGKYLVHVFSEPRPGWIVGCRRMMVMWDRESGGLRGELGEEYEPNHCCQGKYEDVYLIQFWPNYNPVPVPCADVKENLDGLLAWTMAKKDRDICSEAAKKNYAAGPYDRDDKGMFPLFAGRRTQVAR